MPGWNAGRRGSGKPEKPKETEFSGVAVVQGEELVQEIVLACCALCGC